MVKNDALRLEIEDIGIDGEGIARTDGRVVFVKNAIPGESVAAKIILVKKDFVVAVAQSVLRCSPDRVTPPCPYFGKCGGCQMQHIRYGKQLEYKARALLNTLQKAGVRPKVFAAPVPSEREYGCRNKLALPVCGGGTEVGFFARNSHRVVGIDDCLLQNFDAKTLIAAAREFMSQNGLSGYDGTEPGGVVRHVTARKIGGKIAAAAVLSKKCKADFSALGAELQRRLGLPVDFYLNYNSKSGNAVLGDTSERVYGGGETVEYLGYKVAVHPASFFQVNDYVAQKIYGAVGDALTDGGFDTVIDAYAGAGVMSAMLAKTAKRAVSVERNPDAVSAAKRLAADNNLSGLTVIEGDCVEHIPRLLNAQNDSKTALVLDPPKAGIAPPVTAAVLSAAPQKIVYVSCNGATLARDLKNLLPVYELESITPYDMFPQTSSLESVSVLTKK
ncbi:MAG: 23S rRNA (uracil(1939)-C(5))-methyltransferase RlmD [Clostridiales bacterium]|jgi:23S rRNA (uracil1939-C5)-methyltransferase|nr:23S rRNA (uracil(1939)-C(5))-methyltransferase RlmD [Clostridiales bacterium]